MALRARPRLLVALWAARASAPDKARPPSLDSDRTLLSFSEADRSSSDAAAQANGLHHYVPIHIMSESLHPEELLRDKLVRM